MKKFSINPVAVVVWIWLVVMNGFIVATSYFFVILIHELGHFLTAKKLGYSVTKFSFSPYGVELAYFDQNINYRDELLIALAGPLVNLISVIFVVGFWWLFPSIYFFTESFVFISFIIAIFNLIPAYPLDGGRVFVGVASNFVQAKTAKKITMILNVLIGTFFFVIFLVCLFINFNPSLLLFALFMFSGLVDLRFISKYEKISVFTKQTKNFSKVNFYYVKSDTQLRELSSYLQNSKTVIFCVVFDSGKVVNLSETMVKKLMLNFPLNIKIEEIFKK